MKEEHIALLFKACVEYYELAPPHTKESIGQGKPAARAKVSAIEDATKAKVGDRSVLFGGSKNPSRTKGNPSRTKGFYQSARKDIRSKQCQVVNSLFFHDKSQLSNESTWMDYSESEDHALINNMLDHILAENNWDQQKQKPVLLVDLFNLVGCFGFFKKEVIDQKALHDVMLLIRKYILLKCNNPLIISFMTEFSAEKSPNAKELTETLFNIWNDQTQGCFVIRCSRSAPQGKRSEDDVALLFVYFILKLKGIEKLCVATNDSYIEWAYADFIEKTFGCTTITMEAEVAGVSSQCTFSPANEKKTIEITTRYLTFSVWFNIFREVFNLYK